MEQIKRNNKTFGPCPCCGNQFMSVSTKCVIKDCLPVVVTYLTTVTCCKCHQEFCLESSSMDGIYKRWEELQDELRDELKKPYSELESNEEYIKPCPCCGGPADTEDWTTLGAEGMFRVSCLECGLQTPIFSTEHEALEAWNKRVYGG